MNYINYLKKSSITNQDACKVLQKYKNNKNAFIFCDPPYLDSNNTSYNQRTYNKNNFIFDNTYIYVCLINTLKTAKAKIMLIINDNALNRYIFNNYIKSSYIRIYQITKRKTNHLIITNY